MNIEYTFYEYIRDAIREANAKLYAPITEDLIVHLVGYFGFDILKNTMLIAPTENPGQYVLCGEGLLT